MSDSKRINDLISQYKQTDCNFTRKQIVCELTNIGYFPERKQYLQTGELYPELRMSKDISVNTLLVVSSFIALVGTILHFNIL